MGIAAVIEALKAHPLFAHITLTRRSASCRSLPWVTELLEEIAGPH